MIRLNDLRGRPTPDGLVRLGVFVGLAVAAIATIWLVAYLLTGPGATERVLLPALLFFLPLIALGALVGWLAGLAAAAVLRRRRPLG